MDDLFEEQNKIEAFATNNKMKKLNIFLNVLIIVFVCALGLRGKISGEKFDSRKWKNANLNLEENMTMRWDMMNSLRNNYKLIGMSKNEIVNLLGKPASNFSTEKEFRYYLGYSKTGINTGSLTITFENEKVAEINVWQG
ncbi:hypothetical protein SGQ83_10220 [Flavobacterium sp. Fl-318]|uniref:Outer membrane protein assembly factor BamE n=1 Tax=Flavobacterium cupriresistens TaxID=2893885 RepID=A0ABU4RAW4_9FLAO|nr:MULTISPECIES: hypothetical protein [unclassified Flavobacterium]MDX6189727.1 hypothetical protein [Flavobacterium sp. Fl-318]UFH40867.1 hypothetical protein LNP23_13735 [Flavobacterium sp. F-323]